jgi:hypothetical protein
MREQINEIQKKLRENPKFQEQIKNMKPKRSIWGFLGVILFFFVPEILNDFYSKEILEWLKNYAQGAPNEQMRDSLIWLSQKTFDGEVSYLNITLGILFLIWLFKK